MKDLNAIFDLGYSYETGENRKKSIRRAKKLYKVAAEQGHANAQCRLGIVYIEEIGIFKKVLAVKWFRKADDQGNAKAHVFLGYCYLSGKGVKENAKEAERYFNIGAKMNQSYSTYSLGKFYNYEYRLGLYKDLEEAINKLKKSC